MIAWWRFVVSWLVYWFWRLGISLTAVTLSSSQVIACANVFVENGSIRTMESILLSISMAQVVDLASGLFVSVESVIMPSATIKGRVGVMSNHFDRLDLLYFVWAVL